MSYYKTTTISGYDTTEENPFGVAALGQWTGTDAEQAERYASLDAWQQEHYKVSVFPGHWKPQSAAAKARRMGLVRFEMIHNIHDASGHGRGSRKEFRFDEAGRLVEIGPEIDVDDSAEVHDICDELEGR
jgi:hypothetical protein